MRIIVWNIRRAYNESKLWDLLIGYNPDIALLQEVSIIPDKIKESYSIRVERCSRRNGTKYYLSNAILVKGKILDEINLKSDLNWVNDELETFKGNAISYKVELVNGQNLNVISVYSPAWAIPKERYVEHNIDSVRLSCKKEIWFIDLLWYALKCMNLNDDICIVGGDFNSSETFDTDWKVKHRVKTGFFSCGNREIIERFNKMGYKECLREYNQKIVPTFKDSRSKDMYHQLDHLYVSDSLYFLLADCKVGDRSEIIDKSLSDHLPVIADFE